MSPAAPLEPKNCAPAKRSAPPGPDWCYSPARSPQRYFRGKYRGDPLRADDYEGVVVLHNCVEWVSRGSGHDGPGETLL